MNAIHVNTGRRISVMPGARMLMIVMMKLNAAAIEDDAEDLQAEHPEVDVEARG